MPLCVCVCDGTRTQERTLQVSSAGLSCAGNINRSQRTKRGTDRVSGWETSGHSVNLNICDVQTTYVTFQ